MSSLSLIPEEKKLWPNTSKSTESLYSSSSSKYSAAEVYKKSNIMRQASLLPANNTSDIRQRVLSARRLRVKSIQNQLVAAQHTITELANENRILRTIHKRQDSALAKYESTNAELPQLLNSHAEELRVWQTKCKKLQTYNKELLAKLKQKDIIILNLTDENKHLTQLNKNKNLEERERLTEKVKQLEELLEEKDKDTRLLTRKIQLEEKSFKTQLQQEHQRYKELLNKFENLKVKNGINERRINYDVTEKSLKSSLLPTRMRSYKDIIREQNSIHRKEIMKTSHQHFKDNQSNNNTPSPKLDDTDNKTITERSLSDQTINIKNVESCISSNMKEIDFAKVMNKNRFVCYDLSEEEENAVGGSELKEDNDNQRKDSLENRNKEGIQSSQYSENSFEEDELDDENRRENKYNNLGNYEINENDSDNDSLDVFVGGKKSDTKPIMSEMDSLNLDSLDLKSNGDNFKNIRRKISEDYKQKELYLDTFCQETIGNSEYASHKRTKNIDPNKKSKLLAALKNIDAEKNDI